MRGAFYTALIWFLLILAFALLGSCLPATYNAGIRRMAEVRAQVRGLEDARAFCVDAGLERTCGEARP